MADNPTLVANLQANLSQFEKDMEKAGKIASDGIAGIEKGFASIAVALGAGALGGVVGGLAAKLFDLINPMQLATAALAKLGDIMLSSFGEASPQVRALDVVLKEHSQTLKEVKDLYGQAASGMKALASESASVLGAKQAIALLELRTNLDKLVTTIVDGASKILPSTMAIETGIADLVATVAVPGKFKPFEDAIIALRESLARGEPDIRAFREAIARVAQENPSPQIQLMARELLAMTDNANTADRAVRALGAGMQDMSVQAVAAAAAAAAFGGAIRQLAQVAEQQSRVGVSTRELIRDIANKGRAAAAGTEERIAIEQAEIAALKQLEGAEKRVADQRAARARPAGGGAGGGRDALADLNLEIEQATRRAELEAKLVFASAEQRRAQLAVFDAEARMRRQNITLTQEQIAAMSGEIAKMAAAEAQRDKLKDQLKEMREAAKEFSSALSSGLSELIFEGKKLDEVLRNIIKRLGSKAIDRLLETLLLGVGGKGGGLLPFLSGRAGGGPVTAGHPYMVGERGPELFVPRRDGVIVPNAAGRAGVGTINVNMEINLRGANGDETIARVSRQAAVTAATEAFRQAQKAMPGRQMKLHMLGT